MYQRIATPYGEVKFATEGPAKVRCAEIEAVTGNKGASCNKPLVVLEDGIYQVDGSESSIRTVIRRFKQYGEDTLTPLAKFLAGEGYPVKRVALASDSIESMALSSVTVN